MLAESVAINVDGLQMPVFDQGAQMQTDSGVFQTFNAGLDHPVYKHLSDKAVAELQQQCTSGRDLRRCENAQAPNSFHPMHERRERCRSPRHIETYLISRRDIGDELIDRW